MAKYASDPDRVRPDASFKIKDSLRQINQARPVPKDQAEPELRIQIEAREDINEQGVVTALERYLKDHKPDPTVSIALKTHRPEIRGEEIVVAVDNQLQIDKLAAIKIHLQNTLIKYLSNGYITISFKMFDHNTADEKKKLFTASEKYEHFVKLNPAIADLKVIFGLELE